MRYTALLALEDGSLFYGDSIGAIGKSVGEVVFNTSLTGYQEIVTDPSYNKQIVTLTYPHIGNVGVNQEDFESKSVMAAGMVIRDLALTASNWRSSETLDGWLERHRCVAIAGIDTRRLTRILRDKGAQSGCIIAVSESDTIDEKIAEDAIAKAKSFSGLAGLDLAKEVTTKNNYEWSESTWNNTDEINNKYNVVVYDFGVKHNILRMLVERGCKLTVVPATTTAEEVLSYNPDGVFLSNGPGDPEPCKYAIESINMLLEKNIPLFGICLGHQLLSIASGAKSKKMKFGHHGANHPVQDLANNKVMITSQNHGFAIDEESLPSTLKATHRSLFDNSLQGVERTDKPAFGFQGHPEASPGPHDVSHLFDHFIELMEGKK